MNKLLRSISIWRDGGLYPRSGAGLCLFLGLFFALIPNPSRSQNIVISEIMYNPVPGPDLILGGTNTIDGDEFEFLELYNAGTSSWDLNGWSVNDGVTFNFSGATILAPGGYLVLVENEQRFAGRYPWAVSAVAGQWGGKLSDGGEVLTLRDDTNGIVFAVEYNDSAAWPQRADGVGASLVLSTIEGDPNDPAAWCDSDMFLGTPGATGICAQTDIFINEIIAHTDPPFEDAVEVINLSAGAIDMEGWYLSDSPMQPRKYRITNTIVSAGGYHVFYEYQFNSNPPSFDTNNIPFALSEFGDEVYLTAPNPGTDQLRLVDIVEFDGTPNNVSLGRFPNGTGNFFLMKTNTFGTIHPADETVFRTGGGASNGLMRVGPVLINEVMYHPIEADETGYEYIELYNPSGASVDVSNWRISGVGWTNPPGTSIAAGDFLVIAGNRAQIIAKYGLPEAQVLGDWPGQLQNGGEKLVLRNEEGAAIDTVDYSDSEPWPVAPDGYGPSLERIVPTQDGDTVANWASSLAETNWQEVVWTQTVSGASTTLSFWLDFEGKCVIDDVSVKLDGTGAELVSNADFESGLSSWSPAGNHAYSRTEAGVGVGGSAGLVLAGNLTRQLVGSPDFVLVTYGDAETNKVGSDAFSTSSGQDYVIRYQLRRLSLGGQVYSGVGSASHTVYVGHQGTPGTLNSLPLNTLPVVVDTVIHASNIVGVAQSNKVQAFIKGHESVTNVLLQYRFVYTNSYEYTDEDYLSLPMPSVSNGWYEAALPAAGTESTLVRYHLLVQTTNGFSLTSPRVDDPDRDYGYWVESSAVQTSLPNWRILVDGTPVVYSNAHRACAISPSGQVFTDIRMRHRGREPSDQSSAEIAGFGLRMSRGRLYDAWFDKNQDGINFRSRKNGFATVARRILNESLAYSLQRTIGLPTAHTRPVCIWINGAPSITVEFEAPGDGFLKSHGLDSNDYLSRGGYAGRRRIDGDDALDNFDSVYDPFDDMDASVSGANKTDAVRTNIWYEVTRHAMALLSLTGNGDQYFKWNMIQHRTATNGLWTQYPWDADISFHVSTSLYTGVYYAELHPYYETPLHGSIWSSSGRNRPMGKTLFYPETGEDALYTLPYRHRQQMSLWRHYHTLYSTNYIFPVIDGIVNDLIPAYQQIGASTYSLQTIQERTKIFINNRRDFFMNGGWSDRDANIWNVSNIYDPSQVVINEIMYNPIMGGEYIELANASTQTIDLSWWEVTSGNEGYRIPHGTMLGPTSFVVLADTQWELTNTFSALSDGASVIHRYQGIPIWDHPIHFLSASEYASRIVEIPQITLPGAGAVIRLTDLTGAVIDEVDYAASSPWPAREGYSLELLDPSIENSTSGAWRTSFVLGTPGYANSATNDMDGDQMLDSFEQLVIDSYAGVTNLSDVNPGDDQDGDTFTVEQEFLLGLNPTVDDGAASKINIHTAGLPAMTVDFPTRPITGTVYNLFTNRLYTLETSTNLMGGGAWTAVPAYLDLIGLGQTITYTNEVPSGNRYYRYGVELDPIR